tara:strand:+ start:254 stop:481 length:228 start_codon:yes stop_codon:yes gene_type:complete
MSKNYTNEHPKYKKNNQDTNTKLAKKIKTIKIDPMEFKLMKEAQEESGGDWRNYRKIFYKKWYDYKRNKNIKVIK